MFIGDGEVGITGEGCVGGTVGGLLLAVVMELPTGCAAEEGSAGGVNGGGTVTGATIEIIGGIDGGGEEEFDSECDGSKVVYGKMDSSNRT